MSNTPKTHDNATVQDFLDGFYSAGELCIHHPEIDDIFSGVLELKTAGDTATRSLSRQALFHILQWCSAIDVASINEATSGRYAYRSLAGYAAVARVASKAIERYIGRMPTAVRQRLTIGQEQALIDAPYGVDQICNLDKGVGGVDQICNLEEESMDFA